MRQLGLGRDILHDVIGAAVTALIGIVITHVFYPPDEFESARPAPRRRRRARRN